MCGQASWWTELHARKPWRSWTGRHRSHPQTSPQTETQLQGGTPRLCPPLTHLCLPELLQTLPAKGRPWSSPQFPRTGNCPLAGQSYAVPQALRTFPTGPGPLPAALQALLPNMGLGGLAKTSGQAHTLAGCQPRIFAPSAIRVHRVPHQPSVGRGRAVGNGQFWERPEGLDQKASTG